MVLIYLPLGQLQCKFPNWGVWVGPFHTNKSPHVQCLHWIELWTLSLSLTTWEAPNFLGRLHASTLHGFFLGCSEVSTYFVLDFRFMFYKFIYSCHGNLPWYELVWQARRGSKPNCALHVSKNGSLFLVPGNISSSLYVTYGYVVYVCYNDINCWSASNKLDHSTNKDGFESW